MVPSADVTVDSLAFLGKYRINDNMSAFAGLNRYEVDKSTVTAIAAIYEVSGDELVPVVGAAYENKEIALRVEAVIQAETDVALTAKSGLKAGGLAGATAVTGAKMAVPQLSSKAVLQKILYFGSIHKADWKTAQIAIPQNANTGAPATGSNFSNKTAYSIGIGRKINDSLSLVTSYSTEDGGGSTSGSFHIDGYQTLR